MVNFKKPIGKQSLHHYMRIIIKRQQQMYSHHYHRLDHPKCKMKMSMTHKVIILKRIAEVLAEVVAVVAIFSFQISLCRANNATQIQMTIRTVFSIHRMIKIFPFQRMARKSTISI